ncbi:class I SAM-dependent methyltransferase, partial [uncultured Clostridium sp.]
MSYNSIYNIVGLNNEVNRLETQAKLGWEKEFRTLKWLGLKNGMRILDVGSGTGVYTELLLENLPNSSITALEVDKRL